ncbi:helix-turn-helix domain-containing protein [Flagellimonas sp. S174]|uniref:helix-turn-helix domain-containing protein n=1 Tax=Flagellimonas sp. S174 TaxID=3410790 RepID=UPI003BF48D6C
MKNILSISTVNLDESIKGMAGFFQTEVDIENNELCFELSEEWGKGYVNGFSFTHGVNVIELDFRLKKDVILEFQNPSVKPLQLLYNKEDQVGHFFSDTEKINQINRLECVMVASDVTSHQSLEFEKDSAICMFFININRREFEDKVEDFLPGMNKDLEVLFRDVNGVSRFFYQGYYSLDIAESIEAFTDCELTDFPKSVFLEGKVYEILGHQLRQFLDDRNTPDRRKILRKSTVSAINRAAELIEENLDQVENILTLSKKVGLNQNTLQQGFRHVFGKSVNAYMKELRLKRAKELLESSQMNITEISYSVGINSRSYFSKIFKEKYGMTPKQYVLNSRNKAS